MLNKKVVEIESFFCWKINTILNVETNTHHGALCCCLRPKLYKYKYNYKNAEKRWKIGAQWKNFDSNV